MKRQVLSPVDPLLRLTFECMLEEVDGDWVLPHEACEIAFKM